MVLPCGVESLSYRQIESSAVERHPGNVDAVGRRPYADTTGGVHDRAPQCLAVTQQ